MNAKQAKRLRKRARELTILDPEVAYLKHKGLKSRRLGQCTRGAYKALKSGKYIIKEATDGVV